MFTPARLKGGGMENSSFRETFEEGAIEPQIFIKDGRDKRAQPDHFSQFQGGETEAWEKRGVWPKLTQ